MTTPRAVGLVDALVEVAKGIRFVKKGGKNEAQGYAFTSEADVVAKVGPALLEAGILMVPRHRLVEVREYATKSGAAAFLTTIETIWVFMKGTETLEIATVGQGTDTGGDKAAYKAMTGSKKYGMLQALMIATGDDPEVARSDEKKESEAEDLNKPTTAQMKKMFAEAEKAGVSLSAIVEQETGKLSSKQLVRADVDTILTAIKIIAATGGGAMDSPPARLEPTEGEDYS